MMEIKISKYYSSTGLDKVYYDILGDKKEILLKIFEQKLLDIKLLYKEDKFITSIDFKENKIEKEKDLIEWVSNKLDVVKSCVISNLKNYLLEIPEHYLNSLSTKTQCKKILDIYHILKSSTTYVKFKPLFTYFTRYHIVLMDILGLEVEDNIQDNYIKIYNYVINRDLYRESDTHAILADGVKIQFRRYTPSGYSSNKYDLNSPKRSYSPLYIMKQRFKLARLQTTNNSFYDRDDGLVLTPAGGDSINSIIGCIIEDNSGCSFMEFHFTPISMYNLDPYPKQ